MGTGLSEAFLWPFVLLGVGDVLLVASVTGRDCAVAEMAIVSVQLLPLSRREMGFRVLIFPPRRPRKFGVVLDGGGLSA
jgi:hypothetical protein